MRGEPKGIDLTGQDLNSDPAMEKVIAAQAKANDLRKLVTSLKNDRDLLLSEFADLRNARDVPHSPALKAIKTDIVRLSFGDVHGMRQDSKAVAALLRDAKELQPDHIVLGGDIITCDGFLAARHSMGFVANLDYTYQEDVQATNKFLDDLQAACPKAAIECVEGNHEHRVERYVVDEVVSNKRDAAFLLSLIAPQTLLRLADRGIPYYKATEAHTENAPLGWIKRGLMYFVHSPPSYSKNAASDALGKTAANVTYFCCFSPDTEVATPSGWKTYKDVAEGDAVLTMNKETGHPEWQSVEKLVVRDDYSEYLHFQSKQADILVTPDHAMATICRQTRESRTLSERLPVKRVPANELVGHRFAIPLAAVPDESRPDYNVSDDMLRLVGWFITEGHYERQGSARIAQSDREDGSVNEIEALLQRLGVDYGKFLTEPKGKFRPHDGRTANWDHYSFYLPREWVDKNLRTLVPEKEMQEWMLSLSYRQFSIFLDVLIWADGSVNKTSQVECVQFATNKPQDRDLLQIMCALNGYRTSSVERPPRSENAKPVFAISICDRGYGHMSPFTGVKVPVDSEVWCVVVPNQTLVLRRKGKVFVCGNTHREDSSTSVFPDVGLVKAFNPGCMCIMQPVYRNTNPTNWSQGYQIEFIAKSGNFLCVHVPIWRGASLGKSMIERFKT